MTEHRVSVLSSTLRRYEDPTKSRDPRVVSLLEQLGNVGAAPGPSPHFRAELRAQLVAVAPRIVAEGMTDGATMVDGVTRASPAHATRQNTSKSDQPPWTKLRAISIGRLLVVAASLVTAFAMLLGGAVWMSRKALPGDSLYGVKRASEQFQLMTDSNDAQRAQDHLDFAATRVIEARQLLSRPSASGSGLQADSAVSPHTAKLISSALSNADSDTRAASRLLGDAALQSGSGAPLSPMVTWAPAQLSRLKDLAAAIPSGPLLDRTTDSKDLVHAVAIRATTLEKKAGCACMGNARSDSLGPIPCDPCTPAVKPATAQPGTAGTVTPSVPTVTAPSSTTAGAPSILNPVTVPKQPHLTGGGLPGTSNAKPTIPILPLPPLPLPTAKPSAPLISLGSCGIKLLGLTLPLCSSKTP